jgi:hypothetical protein
MSGSGPMVMRKEGKVHMLHQFGRGAVDVGRSARVADVETHRRDR